MNKVFIIGFILNIISGNLYCQVPEPYKVPAGVEIKTVVPFDEIHYYSDFKRCVIRYIDGNSSLASMNYNRLYQKMQLVNVKKDTGYIDGDYNYTIKSFDFGTEVFLNDSKFGLILASNDSLYPKLGQREYLAVIPVDEGSTNGYSNFVDPSSTNRTMRSGSIPGRRDVEAELANSNRLVKNDVVFFFIDKNERVYPAQSSNIYKIFPRSRDEIREYIKSKRVDFKSRDDLDKLMLFCQSL